MFSFSKYCHELNIAFKCIQNNIFVMQGQTPVDDTDGKTKDDSEDFKKRLRKDLMTRDANR